MNWLYRDTSGAAFDLISAFERTLRLCNLKPGERVMVYTDHHTPLHYVAAALSAAQRVGAEVFQVTIPMEQGEIRGGAVWDLWHSIDLVIDLESVATSVYQPLRVSALAAGVRILRVTQPEDVLLRLPPELEVRDRVRDAEARLRAAREMAVTSPGDGTFPGTELTVNLDGRTAFGLWGAADQPGTWDHWSVAVVVGGANRPRTNGRLVLEIGDVLLQTQRYLSSRVILTIEEGVITRIDGGIDAALLRQWFAAWNDERAYQISHIGWGCDPRADWGRMARKEAGGIGDAESFAGVFQIAFGRDTSWYIGGGTNDVAAHIDFNCLRHSIALDGRQITETGRFV